MAKSAAEFVTTRPVHHEMEDELCLTCHGVAGCPVAADEKITGAYPSVNPMALACTAPLMELTLNGDVGLKLYVPVLCELLFELVPACCFCVGGYNGYEPAVFFHGFQKLRILSYKLQIVG